MQKTNVFSMFRVCKGEPKDELVALEVSRTYIFLSLAKLV